MIYVNFIRRLRQPIWYCVKLVDWPDNQEFFRQVPIILKEVLNYPTHVSKQNFQTLGTIHSWPQVLACLYFVYNMVKTTVELEGMPASELEFINKDNDGFKVSARISHTSSIRKSDGEEQIEEFQARRVENEGMKKRLEVDNNSNLIDHFILYELHIRLLQMIIKAFSAV